MKNSKKQKKVILNWLNNLKMNFEGNIEKVSIGDTEKAKSNIFDHRGVNIVGVRTRLKGREMATWDQPLLNYPNGEVILLSSRIDSVMHYLVRGYSGPGTFGNVEVGPTYISYALDESQNFNLEDTPHKKIYSSYQSDEGGRFFHCVNKHEIIEIDNHNRLKIDNNYIWLSLDQIKMLIHKENTVNMELRSLVAACKMN